MTGDNPHSNGDDTDDQPQNQDQEQPSGLPVDIFHDPQIETSEPPILDADRDRDDLRDRADWERRRDDHDVVIRSKPAGEQWYEITDRSTDSDEAYIRARSMVDIPNVKTGRGGGT